MIQLICHRLAMSGPAPTHLRHTTFQWQGGVITIRNSRIVDHHWSSVVPSTLEQLHEQASNAPVAYLLTYWAVDEQTLHAWALPEDMAYPALSQLPTGKKTGAATVEIFPGEHRIIKCTDSPDFSSFYARVSLSSEEVSKLVEAIKLDDSLRQTTAAVVEHVGPEGEPSDEAAESEEPASRYTSSTVALLEELPQHVEDAQWHKENKRRYEKVLRDPTRRLVEQPQRLPQRSRRSGPNS